MNDMCEYRQYTKPAELDKAINFLQGIVEGISADRIVNEDEIKELTNWCILHQHLIDRHPFSEILPVIQNAVSDNVITDEELADILWVCANISKKSAYYDLITAAIQYLQGKIHGLLADGILRDEEITALADWMEDNSYLSGSYPYDEIKSLFTAALIDGRISDDERNMLTAFLGNFVDTSLSLHVNSTHLKEMREKYSISGVCSCCPDIQINGKQFCFTGASSKHSRIEIEAIITDCGGMFSNNLRKGTDYLIVGNAGNPCWAFACYGRKVEKAVSMRKAGAKISIVYETDFWDAIQDLT